MGHSSEERTTDSDSTTQKAKQRSHLLSDSLIISNIQAVEFAIVSFLLVMEFAPVILHLLPRFGFVAHHRGMPHIAGTQRMHKGSENQPVALVALLAQPLQHRFTVVQMVLLHPLANLCLVRIQDGSSLGARNRFWPAS